MEFYDVIKERVSVKKYKNDEVEKDKLFKMINSTMRAPSWRNKSSYKLIIVKDEVLKGRISEAILNSGNEAANAVIEAPIVVVFIANPEESGEVDNKELYLVDASIAMEHFVLAATAEGYGSCWVAALDEDRVKEALKIPNNFRVIALTPIGKSDEQVKHNDKKDINDFVFLNSFNNPYTENV